MWARSSRIEDHGSRQAHRHRLLLSARRHPDRRLDRQCRHLPHGDDARRPRGNGDTRVHGRRLVGDDRPHHDGRLAAWAAASTSSARCASATSSAAISSPAMSTASPRSSRARTVTAPRGSPSAPPRSLARFIAEKGSVALDGTSLTVNGVDGRHLHGDDDPAHAGGHHLGDGAARRPRQHRGRHHGALCRAACGHAPRRLLNRRDRAAGLPARQTLLATAAARPPG